MRLQNPRYILTGTVGTDTDNFLSSVVFDKFFVVQIAFGCLRLLFYRIHTTQLEWSSIDVMTYPDPFMDGTSIRPAMSVRLIFGKSDPRQEVRSRSIDVTWIFPGTQLSNIFESLNWAFLVPNTTPFLIMWSVSGVDTCPSCWGPKLIDVI